MIALVIFSVGMLGIAALQTISKTSNFEAIQRTYASSLAYDLFERMRMNSGPRTNYVGSSTIIITDPTYDSELNCNSGCNLAELATNDLNEWQGMLLGYSEANDDQTEQYGGLVTPTACLDGPLSPPGQYILTIVWRGQTKITNQSASTCGEGSGLYDDSTVNDYSYRRILELKTYM